MSVVTEILDRLSGISTLKERIIQQDRIIEQMQHILLDQQRDLSEMRGMMKALMVVQSGSAKQLISERKSRGS